MFGLNSFNLCAVIELLDDDALSVAEQQLTADYDASLAKTVGEL